MAFPVLVDPAREAQTRPSGVCGRDWGGGEGMEPKAVVRLQDTPRPLADY